MSRVFALAALSALAGCLELQGESPSPPDGGEGGGALLAGPLEGGVRVMSWNLETFPLNPDTPARVAELVEEHRPDVLAIQEISDASAFADLDLLLDDYVGVIDEDVDNYLRMGLLARSDRVTLSEPTMLFADDGWAFPRPVLSAHVEAPGFDFVLLSVHLKALVDEESRYRRKLAIERLHAYLEDRLAEGGEQDYVVVGDFNDQLTDPEGSNVFSPFLADADYQFLTFPLEQDGQYSYIPFEVMIDHALVTTGAADAYGAGQTQVFALDEIMAGYREISDHRPVVVDFLP